MKMILGLTVRAEYHWGYWIRTPFSSKLQATLPLPPPTTLLGALASYLAREGLLKDPSGKKISGEILSLEIKMKRRSRIDFRSPASILDDALITASAALSKDGKAFIMDDLNRYVTLLFQQRIPERVYERRMPRRYLPKYRSGAIYCGKVYYPSGLIDVAYLFDYSKLEERIDGDPIPVLVEAGWNISRIGSKESLVTVRRVSYVELDESEVGRGKVRTRFYFPSRAGSVLEGESYTEVFWRRGWGRYDQPVFEEYLIPGSRNPIKSSEIVVDAEAYAKLDEDVTIVFPPPRG